LPPAACSVIAMDRDTGGITLTACPVNTPVVAGGPLAAKSDRLLSSHLTDSVDNAPDLPSPRPAAISSLLSPPVVPPVPLNWSATVRGSQP
jgi:hypothetical protein